MLLAARRSLFRLGTDYLFIATAGALLVKSVAVVAWLFDPAHADLHLREAARWAGPWAAVWLAALLLVLGPSQALRGRARAWFLLACNLSISLLLLADLWYLRGFDTMPSPTVVRHARHVWSLRESITSMGRPTDWLMLADLPVLAIVAILFRVRYRARTRNLPAFAALLAVGLVGFSFIPAWGAITGRSDARTRLYELDDRNRAAAALSPVGYHLLSVWSAATHDHTIDLTAEDLDEIRLWYRAKDERLPEDRYKGLLKGRNILLIQVESLEGFVVGRSVEGQEITPTLNRLRSHSLYFPNIREQICEGSTSDAELLVLASVYPLPDVETVMEYPEVRYNALPGLLRSRGYSTAVLHANAGSFWNRARVLTGMGFEQFHDAKAFEQDEAIGMGLSDGSFFRQSVGLLAKQRQPFFAMMITLTSHGPFRLPAEHRDLTLSDELAASTLGDYFQSIHYVDAQLGEFLESLKSEGLADSTAVVIYGDHEGVHRSYTDYILDLPNYDPEWVNNDLRTPLIIYHPSITGETLPVIGGQVDVLPTLCWLAGVDPAAHRMTAVGRNLLNTRKSFAVVRDWRGAKPYRYIGPPTTPAERAAALKGVDVSDKIIRGGYLEKRGRSGSAPHSQ